MIHDHEVRRARFERHAGLEHMLNRLDALDNAAGTITTGGRLLEETKIIAEQLGDVAAFVDHLAHRHGLPSTSELLAMQADDDPDPGGDDGGEPLEPHDNDGDLRLVA